MNEEFLVAPLVMKPTRIYNYTQLIACLKAKQKKLAKYKATIQPTPLKNVLRPKQCRFDVEDVVNGFLHERLRSKQREHEKSVGKVFSQCVKKHIKELKRENDLFVVGSSKISGKVKVLEEVFDKDADDKEGVLVSRMGEKSKYFDDAFLFDMYMFLKHSRPSDSFDQEIKFLGDEYLRYVERFLKENADKIKEPLRGNEDKISVFTKLRYSKEEYGLEVYEGRYMFAELYTLFRCGLLDSVRNLLERFHVFFEHISHRFKTSFGNWMSTKSRPTVPVKIGGADDLFKAFLLGLMDERNRRMDERIIGSIEDFVWVYLISMNEGGSASEVLKMFRNYQNPKGLFLAYVMLKDYDKAMSLMFKGDFPIIPSYFIMKALCPRCTNKKVFVDFVFLAASRFSSTQKKVELISSLKATIEGYYDIVPEMIVKMELYDVLGIDSGACLYLDKKVNQKVIEILKGKNEKKKLIKLYYLIDDETLVVDLINEAITEAILSDTDIDEYLEIIEYYEKVESTKQTRVMAALKSFYLFKKSPSSSTLGATPLLDPDFDLSSFKYVVEKIFKSACDVVEKVGDNEMARTLFKLCGVLGLGEEMSGYANRHLVLLI
ncbi:nuclear pore complex component [Encephalitozoon hellem]|nr:nuclear pore complex component [Encephalitozoon hellem]